MKKIIYLAVFCLLIVSCSKKIHRSALPALAGVSISTKPIPADVIVDKNEIQGTSVTIVYFGIFKTGDLNYADANIPGSAGSLEKKAAIYKALDGTDFDIIVNPKYIVQIKKNLFVKTTTATVVGYGAKIKLRWKYYPY